MPVIDFNPDVLDKAYLRETANKQPAELTSQSQMAQCHHALASPRVARAERTQPPSHRSVGTGLYVLPDTAFVFQ